MNVLRLASEVALGEGHVERVMVKKTIREKQVQNLRNANLLCLLALFLPTLVYAEGVGNVTHLAGVI